jgi:DNA repair protein RecO (recombination protein O)
MPSYTFEGIVLKHFNYGETDQIITFFTRDHGKLPLLAKGVRKISSKRAGSLDLFSLVKAQAVPGRGQLDTLTEVVLLTAHQNWKKHLGRIALAYQLCEIVDKLTPDNQSHPRIFDILHSSLSRIGDLDVEWRTEIAGWILEIVRELGYWPKSQPFTGDIYELVESVAQRPLQSPKLMDKLKQDV